MSETITLPLVNVALERGRDIVTIAVPEHEVDVLRAVHGSHNVRVLDSEDDEGEFSANADNEFLRLQAKYRRINSPDPVLAALRDGPRSLERYGFEFGRGVQQAAPQSLVVNHKKEAAKAAKEAAKAKAKQ